MQVLHLPIHAGEPQRRIHARRPAGGLKGKRPGGRCIPLHHWRQLVEVACIQCSASSGLLRSGGCTQEFAGYMPGWWHLH